MPVDSDSAARDDESSAAGEGNELEDEATGEACTISVLIVLWSSSMAGSTSGMSIGLCICALTPKTLLQVPLRGE